MCVCVCVCVFVCLDVCACVYLCVVVYVHVYKHVHRGLHVTISLHTCTPYMYTIYVHHICTPYMYTIYHISTPYVYTKYVHNICTPYKYTIYVHHICTPFMNTIICSTHTSSEPLRSHLWNSLCLCMHASQPNPPSCSDSNAHALPCMCLGHGLLMQTVKRKCIYTLQLHCTV